MGVDYEDIARPIIVGGCGRSGTTLLRILLDSHGRICCGPESNLFLDGPVNAEALAAKFDVQLELVRRLTDEASSRAEFMARFFAEYANRAGKSRWAEKSPRNVHRIGEIFEWFPRATFIHVLRDGRDVVCSLRTHPRRKVVNGELISIETWKPLDECISRWMEDTAAGIAWRADSRYVEIKYEHLIGRTEETMRGLLAAVCEPWDPAVLEHHRRQSQSLDPLKLPQNVEALEPIYGESIGRWKRDLEGDELQLVLARAGERLRDLGYL